MATVAELEARLEPLKAQRDSAVTRVSYDGRTIPLRAAICGTGFFDHLIIHPEVENAYDRWLDGAFLRQGQARGSFEYSGIVFEEYRGRVGAVDFTDASKAYFFPVGMPGLFRQYNAPADFVDTGNTIGDLEDPDRSWSEG